MKITSLFRILIGCFMAYAGFAQADVPMENWVQLDTEFDYAFVNLDAPWSDRQQIFVDPISVWHPPSEDPTAAKNNIQQLQSRFTKTVTHALTQAGYDILKKPAPGALRLHVEIIDLKLNPPSDRQHPWQDRFMFRVTPGKLTAVAEIQDIDTGTVVLRLADHEGDSDESLSLWEQVDRQMAVWSNGIASTITPITESGLRVAQTK